MSLTRDHTHVNILLNYLIPDVPFKGLYGLLENSPTGVNEKTGKLYSKTFSIVNEPLIKVSPFLVNKKLSTVEFFFELMHHDVKKYEL